MDEQFLPIKKNLCSAYVSNSIEKKKLYICCNLARPSLQIFLLSIKFTIIKFKTIGNVLFCNVVSFTGGLKKRAMIMHLNNTKCMYFRLSTIVTIFNFYSHIKTIKI